MANEPSKAEMKTEIEEIVDRVGPEVVKRFGQVSFAEQHGIDTSLESASVEFLENHVRLFDLKAKVEDEEEKEASLDYSREYHRRNAASLRAYRDLYKLALDNKRSGDYSS